MVRIKAATAHHSVISKEVDEILAKGAIKPSTVVLIFTQMYLCLLSILVVYDPFVTLGSSIATYTYLLLRCLLSDGYGNLYSAK